MAYKIDTDACEMCGACKSACPVLAIAMKGAHYEVDQEICLECGACESSCGFHAILQD